ncbi:hypothetical protein F3Y22_tig00000170pilonHSYRG00054 [Hibiscus syriacus]|uniref:glucan endo-1,3-beta-D-glucosidase n=1 Tax=Hibiscus syriacus TaxID=106335 RepID=A0A6A3D9X1_HIBSY|nr:hypothetical protein F3Y22_tig00003194pilonHSYRG00036 [Hibiscus syriacus]KAE8736111.1 hypothetical protein F3Y22_tig00000170pilonHSYRG00054 [Hibiscus syriacus]
MCREVLSFLLLRKVSSLQQVVPAYLVVPAMRNVVSALKNSSLQDRIKVSTSLPFYVLSKTYPPSQGAFKSSLAFLLNPLLQFLNENRSPFMINLYPYFAIGDSSLDQVLFKPSPQAKVDPNPGLRYDNMFDAQLDAVHFTIVNQRFSLADQNFADMKIIPAIPREVQEETTDEVVGTMSGTPAMPQESIINLCSGME